MRLPLFPRDPTIVARLLLPLFLVTVPVAAVAQRYVVDTFTEQDGLSSTRVLGLDQGIDGLLWVLTSAGLDRYDGTTWETIASSALSSGQISRLDADPGGGVWLSMPGSLYHLAEGGAGREVPLPRSIVEEQINAFAVLDDLDGSRGLAIGTETRGLWVWSGSGWSRFGSRDGLASSRVLALAATDEGLYVGTSEGAYVLSDGSIERLPWKGERGPEDAVRALAAGTSRSGEPTVWIVGSDWLGSLERDEIVLRADLEEPLPRDLAVIATVDRLGALYFGSERKLFRFEQEIEDGVAVVGPPNGLAGEGATALLTDREGNVWVASLRGVSKIGSRAFASYDASHGLLSDEVTAIEPKGDGLALGHGDGITLWRDGASSTRRFDDSGMPPERVGRVLDLESGAGGDLWIAFHQGGLLGLDTSGRLRSFGGAEIAGAVSSVAATPDGLLIGGTKGLFRLVDAELVPTGDRRLRGTYVRRLVPGRDGRLNVLTAEDGLFVRDGSSWRRVRSDEEPAANSLYALLEDSRGRVWVGSAAGLFLSTGDRLVRPEESALRLRRPVYLLVEDGDGRLWIGTDFGVYRWDGETVDHVTAGSGLAGNEANRDAGYVDRDGRVWIGTNRGMTRFDPRLSGPPPPPPVVELLGFSLEGEDLEPPRSATLEHDRSSVTFVLRAVSFASPERLHYRIRLEGLEDAWREVRGPTRYEAHYPGLPPGRYRLHFQARSDSGEWSGEVESPPVIVSRPLWRRGWFLALAFAAVVGLALLARPLWAQRRRARGLEIAVEDQRAELADHRARFQGIVENLAECILITDLDDVVMYASPQVEHFFGYRPGDLVGRPAHRLFAHEADRQTVYERIAARSRGESERYEVELRSADGESRWVEIRAAPYRNQAGEIVGTLGSLTDINERRELERRLSRSQRLQAVGQLAGGVAHDFNNLLTIITGSAELLEEEGEARDSPYLAAIRSATDRAASLTRQLLAFSRRQMLEPRPLNVNRVITDAVAMLGRTLSEDIEIRMDLDDDLGTVEADPTQIEQVLVNLAVNARDAMPRGGVLRIATANVERRSAELHEGFEMAAGSYVQMVVSDTGVGMEPRVRDHAFEPFFTTKSEGRGTGLGLATVYGIVKQSDGYVFVDSAPGEGTTFSVYLPRSYEPTAPDVEGPVEPTAPGAAKGRATVLVAEDEQIVRKLFVDSLRKRGYDVLGAADGSEALALVQDRDRPIDLLVTDLVMPGIGGRELANRLLGDHPELPVLFVSGYDRENPLQGDVSDEQMSFLQKPVTLSRLAEEVARLLEAAERRSS